MAGDTSSMYQPSFGRRGGVRPRFFAQADGDNDTGSLGALLNDVSKAVSMNTGFSGVVLSASSMAAASSIAASNLQPAAPAHSTITHTEASSSKTTSAPSAHSGDAGGTKIATAASGGLSVFSASTASAGTQQHSVASNGDVVDPATASAAPVRPPVFGRRGGSTFGFDAMSSNSVPPQQPTLHHHQQHQQQQLPPPPLQQHQQQQQQQQLPPPPQQQHPQQQQQPANSVSSVSPAVTVSNAPAPKFGFKFGGLRPPASVAAPASTAAPLVSSSVSSDGSPVRAVTQESHQVFQSSPPKVISSSSPSNPSATQRSFVAAHAPSLLTSRTSKPQIAVPPAPIGVSSRAAQLMREIGEGEDSAAAVSSGVALDHVWRERSSRSVAGDVGPHIVAHAKVDTGLPRELASRDRARIANIYSTGGGDDIYKFFRESERNKKVVERLRAQLQDALSSDRVAMLENAIVERDRAIEALTRDNKMLQRNALIQEKELEGKRDIENDIASRVKEKNEDLRVMRERLKKFKELHVEQQKALHVQQQQQQRLQAAHDEVRRKLAAALSDPSFDADEARKQLVERDTHIASLERELRIFRHKKESDGRLKGREHKVKDNKVQQLQSAIEEAQLQLAARGRELQAQSLRIKALEEEVHVWQQRARHISKAKRNESSNHVEIQKGAAPSPSLFLTEGVDSSGPGPDTLEYRPAITPPPREPSVPSFSQRTVPRVKTPQRLKTPPQHPKAQVVNQAIHSEPRKLPSADSARSKSRSSIDDMAYVSDFDDAEDGLSAAKDHASSSGFQPVPPMRPPQPMSLPSSTSSSSRHVAVAIPTNASLARGRPR